jgi:exonuclease III
MSDFCQEFDDYLESLMLFPGKVIIAGDINIHVKDSTDPDARKFNKILECYGLIKQRVCSATNISGGILDLVITRKKSCDSLNVEDINQNQIIRS